MVIAKVVTHLQLDIFRQWLSLQFEGLFEILPLLTLSRVQYTVVSHPLQSLHFLSTIVDYTSNVHSLFFYYDVL
ncbi:hypothetical protein RDI58_017772 [Solanum bulbocastanum]|uniref:Uncharacterized protein n=1 Tax=Solanum bulbocastanum TaxID=147425 RepID=A0AAN8Y9I1_SOLBU